MSGTSAAIPERLLAYGEGGQVLADELRTDAGALSASLERFRAASHEHVPAIPPLPDSVHHLAHASQALAERTAQVGRAFQRAGGAGGVVRVPTARLDAVVRREFSAGDAQRLLAPYTVTRSRQEAVAWRDLVAGRWERRTAQVQGFFARLRARMARFDARLTYGRASHQWREARRHLEQTKRVFRERVASATAKVEDATQRLRTPHGRLARVGRFAGPAGIVANAWGATNSPYDGARGTVDQVVAGVTALAGVVLLTGLAPATAGAVVIAGTAWMVGNLAVDAWQNRQAIGQAVSNGISSVGNALSNVGSFLGIGS